MSEKTPLAMDCVVLVSDSAETTAASIHNQIVKQEIGHLGTDFISKVETLAAKWKVWVQAEHPDRAWCFPVSVVHLNDDTDDLNYHLNTQSICINFSIYQKNIDLTLNTRI
jgi:hypothetical protein